MRYLVYSFTLYYALLTCVGGDTYHPKALAVVTAFDYCALGEGAAWPTQSNLGKFKDEYCEKIRRQQTMGGQARADNNAYRLI